MSGYWFVASPYSHPDPAMREERNRLAASFAAFAFRTGLPVYVPIVAWHQVAVAHALPTDAAAWAPINDVMLERARGVIVLAIAGWRESAGVRRELELALQLALQRPALDRRYYTPRSGGGSEWDWISRQTAEAIDE